MTTRTKTTPNRVIPVGEWEIADLLGVKRHTVKQWRFRGLLPRPEYVVNRSPAWSRYQIIAWAIETGRLKPNDPRIAKLAQVAS